MSERTFNDFLMFPPRMGSEWLLAAPRSTLTLYVRRTPVAFRRTHGDIQIANIINKNPGKGELTRFLDNWSACAVGMSDNENRLRFYFENVLNPRLAQYLVGRGYKLSRGSPIDTPCFIWEKCDVQL